MRVKIRIMVNVRIGVGVSLGLMFRAGVVVRPYQLTHRNPKHSTITHGTRHCAEAF